MNGSLKVVTTNLQAGYLRKNGVPYSENATVTEYFSVARLRNGTEILVVTSVVDDPAYLTQPYIVSSRLKKQADGSGWEPSPCSVPTQLRRSAPIPCLLAYDARKNPHSRKLSR